MVVGIVYLFVLNPLLSAIPWIRKGYPYDAGRRAHRLHLAKGRTAAAPTTSTCSPAGRRPAAAGLVPRAVCAGRPVSLQRDIS